jgi:hypothetical protein
MIELIDIVMRMPAEELLGVTFLCLLILSSLFR